MSDIDSMLAAMQITRADHLPIVAAFCRRIGLVEAVNGVVPTEMAVDVGTVMEGMVLDTLSGRSPLYRLAEFFEHQDTELLLGRHIESSAFNDTTVGRAMDAVFAVGADKVFNAVAFGAARRFPLDMGTAHFDTTSVNVWGEYDPSKAEPGAINITFGHSKDKRPDLKQFLIRMLCVGRSIPILGGCEDGNASDKTLNNPLLTRISQHMKRHGLGAGEFLYTADSAFVTPDNLAAVGDNLFVTRLPFSYKETARVVSEAVEEGNWECIGKLNKTEGSAARPPAIYDIAEKSVTLYERQYRAIVVHSSAHDKRRLKRIERELAKSEKALASVVAEEGKREYFCRPDAEAAAARLQNAATELHRIEASVEEVPKYGRGRPPKNRPRKPVSVSFKLTLNVVEKTSETARKREEAGCFVLLTNVPIAGPRARTAAELLAAYKDQHAIERDFSFLKDPLIVNDLFLKKAGRIEALGAVVLMALLVWNLIEHTLRAHLEKTGRTLPGWDKKPTSRPTTFMMTTKFTGLQIVRVGSACRLALPLSTTQRLYLQALGLTEAHLTGPLRT